MTRSADVIVVGAGIVGCAVAYELTRRGRSVQVVDERLMASGATHASAGILAPYIEAEAASPLLELTVRSLGLFDDFIRRVSADSGTCIQYRRTGTLQVATDSEGLRVVQQMAAHLEQQGVAADLLDARAVRAEEPCLGDGIAGGLVVPTHGFVAAGELTRAMAAAACKHGAQLVEGRRVQRIVLDDGSAIVETDRGPISGSAVVLAAGSWSPKIDIAGLSVSVPVHPVRGQLLRLKWQGPPLRRVTWTSRCYLVPWEDGTLLVGATSEDAGYDDHTTVAGVRDLLDAACEALPHAWSAELIDARAGLRPATPDELPIIGPSSVFPNLMYTTGHYRNGVLLTPLTAEIVGRAMVDGYLDRAIDTVGPRRFGAL